MEFNPNVIKLNGQDIDVQKLTDDNLLQAWDYVKNQLDDMNNKLNIIKEEVKERVEKKKKKLVTQASDGKFIIADKSARTTKSVNYTKLYEILSDNQYKQVVNEKKSETFSIKKLKTPPKTMDLEILEGEIS